MLARFALLGAMIGAVAPAAALATEEWKPSKVVRIVVPIVGSTNDVIARIVAPELQKAIGQAVIVENKGGAGGTIGANEVAKSPPDGHTLLVGFNGPLAINPTLMANMPYDSQKDLTPITLAGDGAATARAQSERPGQGREGVRRAGEEEAVELWIRVDRQRVAPHDGDAEGRGRCRHYARPV
jgi:tripartite-type tricarboxylate transporter receptor subunit TctC